MRRFTTLLNWGALRLHLGGGSCKARSVDRIRIVLLRTHNGKNLGAVARAMKNFGFHNLVIADPGPIDWSDVHQMAVRAQDITEGARRVDSLEAAIDGCTWVVGTSMRPLAGQRQLHPQVVAEALVQRAQTEDVALVFGEERIGLTNRDLLRCHDVSAIPTTDALPSLNLAQAALVYLWQLAQAKGEVRAATPSAASAQERDYQELESALRGHMQRIQFADPDRPKNGVLELIQTLKRAGLTQKEARLWQAILQIPQRAGPASDPDPQEG